MLETWDAAQSFTGHDRSSMTEIARVLGWVYPHKRTGDEANQTAKACARASEVIAKGGLKRNLLRGVSVRVAYEICHEAAKLLQKVEKREESGKVTKKQRREIQRY